MSIEIFNDLKKRIKGNVEFDKNILKKYSRDTSIFEVMPHAVVFPKNTLDIQNIVHFINDHKHEADWISIIPRSAGTCMSGGAIGEGLIIDFTKNLNNFEIDDENKILKSDPGVYFRDFEKESDKLNLEMPIFPASKDLVAIGGMVSNNCGGEKSLKYGQIRNFVQSVKAVLSNGREYEFKKISLDNAKEIAKEDSFIGGVYKRMIELLEKNYTRIQEAKPKTLKNSSGYALWDVYDKENHTFDLSQLFTGSQGTLGAISEVRLRLQNKKKHQKLVTIFLPNWNKLPDLVNKIRLTDPISLETFDDTTMMLGFRFMPEIAKKLNQSLFKFLSGFWPEFLMGVKLMRMPKLIILAHFEEDNIATLNDKIQSLEKTLKEGKVVYRVIPDINEAKKYFIIRRESFLLLRKKVGNKITAPFIDDFCVLPEKLPEFLPKLLTVLKKYKIKANIAGHAGSGNLHIIPLMDLKNEKERAKIRPCADEVYKLIIDFEGTITAEHNDGLMRTSYVPLMFGQEMNEIFEEVKNIFDPKNIFNPGKKVMGDKNFAFEHLKRD